MSNERQVCITCKVDKPLTEYHRDRSRANSVRPICKPCRSKHRRVSEISDEAYDKLLQAQNYSCAICGVNNAETKAGLVVDHDYKTLTVRGLLCHYCNVGLGLFFDEIERLHSAIHYLKNANKTS